QVKLVDRVSHNAGQSANWPLAPAQDRSDEHRPRRGGRRDPTLPQSVKNGGAGGRRAADDPRGRRLTATRQPGLASVSKARLHLLVAAWYTALPCLSRSPTRAPRSSRS